MTSLISSCARVFKNFDNYRRVRVRDRVRVRVRAGDKVIS
jgi:hypothetical protein